MAGFDRYTATNVGNRSVEVYCCSVKGSRKQEGYIRKAEPNEEETLT